jgi:peptidoglycan/xylan/chitin deacetylase (PgdA/CDA1 family)
MSTITVIPPGNYNQSGSAVTNRCLIAIAVFSLVVVDVSPAVEPIPDKLVVLTFDDSVKSHFTIVGPELKKRGFGATFFITEGFEFKTDKLNYLTWEEIARLNTDGFEIGNHTRDHFLVRANRLSAFREQLDAINNRCAEFGIPKPVSFAYAGNSTAPGAIEILHDAGFLFARRGGQPEHPYEQGRGFEYEPGLDHPLLIPSAGDARPDWTIDDFKRAVDKAHSGRIAVLQFHGVPDLAHPWVNSPVERFREYMQYLADGDFKVIAMRDLKKYVDPTIAPRDETGVIEDRKRSLLRGTSRDNFRRPKGDEETRRWLQNMVWYHRFAIPEVRAATGLLPEEIEAALKKFNIRDETRPTHPADEILFMPYPGGRHPRTGFLEGAIRPQRETKISVFLPWDHSQYLVLDIPEAIRRNNEREFGLLYLAHRHVDTMWDKQRIDLETLEWQAESDGSLLMERILPNNVTIGTRVRRSASGDGIEMEMWLTNHSQEILTNLVSQNCLMLKGAPEFAGSKPEDGVIREPYIAIRSSAGNRWCIMGWEPCHRAWTNPPCPCVHSDPKFPDCLPGETKRLTGWLSFYEGNDVDGEIDRIIAARGTAQ